MYLEQQIYVNAMCEIPNSIWQFIYILISFTTINT